MTTQLKCKECSQCYPGEAIYACPECFAPLEVDYPPKKLSGAQLRKRVIDGPDNIWRYHDFLPLAPAREKLPVGNTPLLRADGLAERLEIDAEIWIKNETSNPTHSFKDRVTAVASAAAIELGYDTLACASTGNLANSVAARAAAEGLDAYVLVPDSLEKQKLLATEALGARVITIPGSYDKVNRICQQLAEEKDWGFVNINLRPFYSQGSKTIAYEIIEQLGWQQPDRVVCPAASGSLFTKIAAGIREWQADDLITDHGLPVFHAAQARGCDPIASAWAAGHGACDPQRPDTIAHSLAIGDPADGIYALGLAEESGGSVLSVTDAEIIDGIRLLAETTGVFTETAGGVTTAVLAKLAAAGEIQAGEKVVAVITGDGFKTIDVLEESASFTTWDQFDA